MQKYTIFNKHNKILITKTPKDEDLKDYQRIIDCDKINSTEENLPLIFFEKSEENIAFICDSLSVEEVFAMATKKLYHVFAAGGIVENENKELLFMFRNGYWDLPKGHWELGESFPLTAKREVAEETGIKELEIKDFIDISFHSYYMHGRYELKHTYWYKMKASSKEKLLPQTEEGIKDLCWIKQDKIADIIKASYPNIRHLLSLYANKFEILL